MKSDIQSPPPRSGQTRQRRALLDFAVVQLAAVRLGLEEQRSLYVAYKPHGFIMAETVDAAIAVIDLRLKMLEAQR